MVFILISLLFLFLFTRPAFAVCPICTVAVGAGVGISRWLGIDDLITGLWIGGLIVSLIFWTINWLEKKRIKFFGRGLFVTLSYYLIILLPLYFLDLLGHKANAFLFLGNFFLDKLSLGVLLGSFGFWAGAEWYEFLKQKNQGKAYFPFQKVVMPIALLIILSFIFYFLTK